MTPPHDPVPDSRRRALLEVTLSFLVATVAAAILYRIAALYSYYSAVVAGILLYLPVWVLRRRSLAAYGLTFQPLGRNLLLVAVAVGVIFPLFFFGFVAWERVACASRLLRPLVVACAGASPLAQFHFRLPLEPLEFCLNQLVVVALPEEFFFRGFLQGRLADVWPSRKILGVAVGPVVVASSLFALCHLAVQGNPATLAVFFPGLVFGWMRARTGSILPGTLFHALCNLYIETLHRSFFP